MKFKIGTDILAVLFFWLAFADAFASVASPITATYPAMMIILALIFLKERPSRRELFGLTVTLVGIFGVSFFYY